MTASHSCRVMLTSIRSRRIPALLTRTSRPPKVLDGRVDEALGPVASRLTSSPLATASAAHGPISSTTSPAGPAERPGAVHLGAEVVDHDLAPWRANSMAWPRPMPRPAPVTMTTLPSQIPAIPLLP